MTEKIKKLRRKILLSIVNILPYEPFDINIISKACNNIGLDVHYASLLFPEGRIEVLHSFIEYIDLRTIKKIKSELKEVKGTTNRIFEALKIRIQTMSRFREIIPKIITFCMIPSYLIKTYKYVWNSMSLIWYVAGNDKSIDFNYYTKRGLLVNIYLNTIMYWLLDKSEDSKNTYIFLYQKLASNGKLGKRIKHIKSFLM